MLEHEYDCDFCFYSPLVTFWTSSCHITIGFVKTLIGDSLTAESRFPNWPVHVIHGKADGFSGGVDM